MNTCVRGGPRCVQSSDSHAESVELFVGLFVDGLHELFGVRSDRYADRRRLLLGNLNEACSRGGGVEFHCFACC